MIRTVRRISSVSDRSTTFNPSVSRSGTDAFAIRVSERRISPKPMAARATARRVLKDEDTNSATPNAINTGESQATLNESAWTISVEPTSAPSISARPIAVVISPFPAKDDAISAVAVLLCSSPVMPKPMIHELKRLPAERDTQRCSVPPSDRLSPVRTIRTPQIRSATPPIMLINSSIAKRQPGSCSLIDTVFRSSHREQAELTRRFSPTPCRQDGPAGAYRRNDQIRFMT